MPYKSLAQEGFLHAHSEKLGKKGLAEWDAATKGKHLPEHASKENTVKKDSKPEAKHEFSHSTIRHFKDGSHSLHHHHESDKTKDVKHAVATDDAMHDSLHQHVGIPNSGEAQANAGQSGIPGEAAAAPAAAGAPAPGM